MRPSAQVLRILLLPLGVAMTLSCGSNEDNTTTPQTVATPITQELTPPAADATTAKPELAASVTIASVQLDSDCKGPSSKKPPSAGGVTAKPSRRDRRSSGFKQPCRQSVIQLAFIGHPDKAATVELRTIRLMD
ncbi:MAG: hypothetical protein JKY56_09915, partial [Kofleriaceae bacterium]|nr:hypothetical protein [Kofleriaceae bacterium]